MINMLYYLEYIIKKRDTLTDNSPITPNENKIENRLTFKIRRGYYWNLLTPVKLFGSTKNKITKDENGENVPH